MFKYLLAIINVLDCNDNESLFLVNINTTRATNLGSGYLTNL